MASIEYQGIKFSGGKFFIILSLIGAIVGGGWSAYKFYDDYLDMKQQVQEFVAPDLSGFDKKIDLEISESVKNALEAPEPPSQELTKYIWAED